MSISKNLRFTILERDGFRCQYCGATAAEAELHIDHYTPVSMGGTDHPDNLRTACKDCNAGKAGKTISDPQDIKDLEERVNRLMYRNGLLEECCNENSRTIELHDQNTWSLVKRINNAFGLRDKAAETCSNCLFFGVSAAIIQYGFQPVLKAIDITINRLASKNRNDFSFLRYMYGVVKNLCNAESDGVSNE